MTLDPRQYHLANFGHDRVVRPAALADKVQKRLMLGCHPTGRRDRRNRLDTLALARHHQADAIIPQRPRPVGMADYAHKSLNIRAKARCTAVCSSVTHPSPPAEKRITQKYQINRTLNRGFLTQ